MQAFPEERGAGGAPRAGFTLAMTVGPEAVGKRVMLRYRLPEGGYTDVLGILTVWTESTAEVRRADDALVQVSRADIVAGKPVPAPPPRRSGRRNLS